MNLLAAFVDVAQVTFALVDPAEFEVEFAAVFAIVEVLIAAAFEKLNLY